MEGQQEGLQPRKNENQLNLLLPADLAKVLDDYWHTERFPSKGAAIRHVVSVAIECWRKGDTYFKNPQEN